MIMNVQFLSTIFFIAYDVKGCIRMLRKDVYAVCIYVELCIAIVYNNFVKLSYL